MDRNHPDLQAIYDETDGEPCPHFVAAEKRK
jgi:hypothetical protein